MSKRDYKSETKSLQEELLQAQLSLIEQQAFIEKLEAENRELFATVLTFWIRATRAGVDDEIDLLLVKKALNGK